MLRSFKHAFVGTFAAAALVAAISPNAGSAAEPMSDARAQDRAAIQNLVVKYAHAYDALDADGYVSVFAEDAQFSFGGMTLHGRAEIRNVITSAKESLANSASGEPAPKSYHSISNTLIEFVSETEARHRSYWQVVVGPSGGPFNVTNMGVYEDVIMKRNGEWLIQNRNIPQ
jgi:uncharacterized protein (TIGR02246 family)